MCLLAFFILVDVECLGTESGSEQETQLANNPEPQSPQCELVVAGEVEQRFDQTDLHIIKDLELLLLSAANGEQFQIPEALSSYMEGDVIRLV